MNVIRIATEYDRDVWKALRGIVYDGCPEAVHEEDINIWLRDSDKVCFLIEENSKVAGFLEASLRNVVDGCLSSPVGYMEGVCFFPEYRSHGLSKQLMEAAMQWMKDQGCTEMGSDAELHNAEAIKFHQANDFKETFRVVQFMKKLN
ncbi:MAG: GNAT family N-acetyltransferase [Opitutales bacterium]|nr:GNAT family N-acetyltransferase [Opitutales bacterium]